LDGGNLVAKYLLEMGAVEFRPEHPFKFTSGRLSPIYVDVRRICGRTRARDDIIAIACSKIYDEITRAGFQVVAGGETAGIPMAAWIADRMNKPMAYIRKQPKGFGRGAQIEGMSEDEIAQGRRFLLVEDLMSEGGSKQNFLDAIRRSGNIVDHCFVVFTYGCFGAEQRLAEDGVTLCALCNAELLVTVAEDLGIYPRETIQGIRAFIEDPELYSRAYRPEDEAATTASEDTVVAPTPLRSGSASPQEGAMATVT
jgi:orotate phosphoribosyltransferase